MEKVSLLKFTYIFLLKNDDQLKQVNDKQPKKKPNSLKNKKHVQLNKEKEKEKEKRQKAKPSPGQEKKKGKKKGRQRPQHQKKKKKKEKKKNWLHLDIFVH